MPTTPDYIVAGPPPPPPPSAAPPSPPPPMPPPPPPPPPTPPATSPATPSTDRPAQPEVAEINVGLRRVLFVESPQSKGTVEVTIGFRAIPDHGQPASASADRLWLAAKTKLDQYLAEVAP